jgi:UDPglucose 6-dehydrogenase
VVVVTAWPQVQDIRWDEAAAAMKGTIVIDGRNVLDPAEVSRHGLQYQGIGRRAVQG